MILVTGANGQLGKSFRSIFSEKEAVFVDRKSGDIRDYKLMEELILDNKIKTIINCAAYTDVDEAEVKVDEAFIVNEKAVEILSLLSRKHDICLVHFSTDYVFDGARPCLLSEDTITSPISVYGQSKLAGELKMKAIQPTGIIVRTSWIYSVEGKNFYTTILRLARERGELNIISDQVGTPTSAASLANAIGQIIPAIKKNTCEIYNYSNEGLTSWYDFAVMICNKHKIECKINPITTEEYKTAARRPAFSVLSKKKIKNNFNIAIEHWERELSALIGSHL